MPGVFGLITTNPQTNLAAPLARMAESLKHYSWYRAAQHLTEHEGVALGVVSLGLADGGGQIAANDDQSLLVAIDGEVYDHDTQRQTMMQRGRVFRSNRSAELLLHGYAARGQEFFRGLNGKFIAAIWDGKRRQLILINDRFGMRPLFYAQVPGRLVFASEIKAVLADVAVSRRANLRGVAQFFTYGHLLGEETLLESVHLLPAAGWLTYDAAEERLHVERYWKLSGSGGTQSEAESLDRIDHAFGQAVERGMAGPHRLGLSLSGGLDARTILGVADDAVPLTTVSIGMAGSMDHSSATELARLTKRTHHQYLLGDGFLGRFEEHLQQMVHLTDGHYLSQCIVMPTLPVYRELGIECLLRGHAGELMHMTKAYSFSLDQEALGLRDENGLEAWLFRRLQTYMLEGTEGKLFAPAYRKPMEEFARASLQACLKESAGMSPPVQRIAHLFITQRLRRETAMSLVKFGSLVETRLPYLDNDLVDALFAAPPDLKLDEKIQAHILRRRRPDFLKVRNVNTGTRMEAGRLARFVGKYRQKVFAKLGVRGYQPYERLGLWLRRELRPLVQKLLLHDRCLGRGLFDPQTVRNVVHNHWSGANHTFLILAMMTYEMGQREFVDGDQPAPPGSAETPVMEAVA